MRGARPRRTRSPIAIVALLILGALELRTPAAAPPTEAGMPPIEPVILCEDGGSYASVGSCRRGPLLRFPFGAGPGPMSLRGCGGGESTATCGLSSPGPWTMRYTLAKGNGAVSFRQEWSPSAVDATTVKEWITHARERMAVAELVWRLYSRDAGEPLFLLKGGKAKPEPFGTCASLRVGRIDLRWSDGGALSIPIQSQCRDEMRGGKVRVVLAELLPAAPDGLKFTASPFQWSVGGKLDSLEQRRSGAAIDLSFFPIDRPEQLFDASSKQETPEATSDDYLYKIVGSEPPPAPPPTAPPWTVIPSTIEAPKATVRPSPESSEDSADWLGPPGWLETSATVSKILALFAVGLLAIVGLWGLWTRVWLREEEDGVATSTKKRARRGQTGESLGGTADGRFLGIDAGARTVGNAAHDEAGVVEPRATLRGGFQTEQALGNRRALQSDTAAFEDAAHSLALDANQRRLEATIDARIASVVKGALAGAIERIVDRQIDAWGAWILRDVGDAPAIGRAATRAPTWQPHPDCRPVAEAFLRVCLFAARLHAAWSCGAAPRAVVNDAWNQRTGGAPGADEFRPLREEHLRFITQGLEAVIRLDWPLARGVVDRLNGDFSAPGEALVEAARGVWPHDWSDICEVRRFAREWAARRLPALQGLVEALPVELKALTADAAGLVAAEQEVVRIYRTTVSTTDDGLPSDPAGTATGLTSLILHTLIGQFLKAAEVTYTPVRLYEDDVYGEAVETMKSIERTRVLRFDHSDQLVALGVDATHGRIVRLTRPLIRFRAAEGAPWELDGGALFLFLRPSQSAGIS